MQYYQEKKIYMLLKAVVFHYHGLNSAEKNDLEESAKAMDAQAELDWALNFISADHLTAFDRARVYLNGVVGDYPKEKRTELIQMIWHSNNIKGYVTEMEATAMLKLAVDWRVEKELMGLVLS
ncbi:MAG: hypothetical protein CRN43_16865 [Candidatus Nephrothrix sp. EaCA]|nr:MAG: hypothetical protein CRN43_16865 [Candidatus Nephrothrix sp. EaCA]